VYWNCPNCGTGNILQDVQWCPGCKLPKDNPNEEADQEAGLPKQGEVDELAAEPKEDKNAKGS
jgi:hypothetical protein